MKPTQKQRGWMLLELLLALLIIGALLAVVAPRLPGALEGAKLRAAQRELVSGLRYARNKAVGGGPVAFILDTDQRRLRIEGPGVDKHRRKLSLPDAARLKLITAKSERRSATSGAILFYADGSSSGGRIALHHGGRVSRIDIDWLSGKISLAD